MKTFKRKELVEYLTTKGYTKKELSQMGKEALIELWKRER